MKLKVIGAAWLAIGIAAAHGCKDSGIKAKPYSKEEYKQMRDKELAPEIKELEKLEKKLGKEHPEVKQRRMELGLDPFPGEIPGSR